MKGEQERSAAAVLVATGQGAALVRASLLLACCLLLALRRHALPALCALRFIASLSHRGSFLGPPPKKNADPFEKNVDLVFHKC